MSKGIIVGSLALGLMALTSACAVTTPGGYTVTTAPVVAPVVPVWHDHPGFYRPVAPVVVHPAFHPAVVHPVVHAAPVRHMRVGHKVGVAHHKAGVAAKKAHK